MTRFHARHLRLAVALVGFAFSTVGGYADLTVTPISSLTIPFPNQPSFVIQVVPSTHVFDGSTSTDYVNNIVVSVNAPYSQQGSGALNLGSCGSDPYTTLWSFPYTVTVAGTYSFYIYTYGWGYNDDGTSWDSQGVLDCAYITFTVVTPQPQTVTFPSIANKSYGDAPFTLSATASSGLPITYTSNNPAVATVSGNTVTLTGGGTVTITASQAGNASYSPASATQTFTVAKAGQTITFGSLPNHSYGDAPFALSATASSGLPVSFTVTSGPATLAGNTVTLTGADTVTITASQAGNASYSAASPVSQSFTVANVPTLPIITTQPANRTAGAGTNLTGKIAAGNGHYLSLRDDGTVGAWGFNWCGQLGDGTTTNRSVSAQVSGLPYCVAVGTGVYHSLVVTNSGTVWAWGSNDSYQLGDGTNTNRLVPIQVNGLSNIRMVSGGYSHSLALANDGTVWAWGNNGYGQLGDGSCTNRPTPVQLSGLTGCVAVAAGWMHSMALKNDGTVWAWGFGSFGQLGNGIIPIQLTPVQVNGLSGVTALAAGAYHSLGAKNDGTVWSWGYNDLGQLGDGTTTMRPTPVLVAGLTGCTAVAACMHTSWASKNNGTIWAWGYNGGGLLGDGTTTDQWIPVRGSGLSEPGAVVATFSVVATGSPTPTYQWQRKAAGQTIFTNLTSDGTYYGVNAANLTVHGVTMAMNGDQFRCVVTNSAGNVTSNAVTLTVIPPPPVITSSRTTTAMRGSAFNYTITATNSPTVFNASGLPSGLTVDTGTGIISGTPTQTGTFTVTLTADNAGGGASTTLTLTVNSPVDGITWNFVEFPAYVQPGQLIRFRGNVTNSGATTWVPGQYYFRGTSTDGGNISFGSLGSSVLPGQSVDVFFQVYALSTPEVIYHYDFNIFGPGGQFGSACSKLLSVSNWAPFSNSITSPTEVSVAAGQSLAYQITSAWGATSYGVTWPLMRTGYARFNPTTGQLTITPLEPNDWFFTASPYVMTQEGVRTNVVLHVSDPGSPLAVGGTSMDGVVNAPFGWYCTNLTSLPATYSVAGQIPPGLTFDPAYRIFTGTPTQAGAYPMMVIATTSSETINAPLTITIAADADRPTPPSPLWTSNLTSDAVTLTWGASNSTLGIQYYQIAVDGSSIALGSGSDTGGQIGGYQPGSTHLFKVRAQDTRGVWSFWSSEVEVHFLNSIPTITTQPANQSVTAGQPVTFLVVATGTAPLSYQWRKNGANIPGETNASYTIASAQPTDAGTYTVVVTNAAGSITSDNAVLTFSPAPAPPAINSPLTASGSIGVAFSYTITASNTPTSYNASGLPPGLSFSTNAITGTPTTAGTYSVNLSATNAAGTGPTATLTFIVSSGTQQSDPTNQNQLNIHLPLTP